MVSAYEQALLVTLICAYLLTLGNGRAWLWLTAGAADYIITSAFSASAGWPSAPFFTALVDASVAAAVGVAWRKRGIARWEAAFCHVFIGMMALDLARVFLFVSDDSYRLGLEVLNYAAMLAVGGPRIVEYVRRGMDSWGYRAGPAHRANSFLSAPVEGTRLLGFRRAA